MISLPSFQCAVCNRPVDHAVSDVDMVTGVYTFVLRCHDRREIVIVADDVLLDSGTDIVRPAFVYQRDPCRRRLAPAGGGRPGPRVDAPARGP